MSVDLVFTNSDALLVVCAEVYIRLFRKFVLFPGYVYVVLSTCVKTVNTDVLIKRYVLKVDRKFVMFEFIIQF